jgi:hypothetical protein
VRPLFPQDCGKFGIAILATAVDGEVRVLRVLRIGCTDQPQAKGQAAIAGILSCGMENEEPLDFRKGPESDDPKGLVGIDKWGIGDWIGARGLRIEMRRGDGTNVGKVPDQTACSLDGGGKDSLCFDEHSGIL